MTPSKESLIKLTKHLRVKYPNTECRLCDIGVEYERQRYRWSDPRMYKTVTISLAKQSSICKCSPHHCPCWQTVVEELVTYMLRFHMIIDSHQTLTFEEIIEFVR